MAGTIINTLYPPQVGAVAPAFAISDNQIYIDYAFSSYNTISDAGLIHIALVAQDTNENVLYTGDANTGILIQKVSYNSERQSYCITLTPENIIKEKSNDIITTGWIENKIYKLQLRFDNTEYSNGAIPASTSNYFNTNQDNFSEWSTVCLLQPIIKPFIVLTQLQNDEDGDRTEINNDTLLISGNLKTQGAASNIYLESKEKIKYYTIDILKTNGEKVFSTDKNYLKTNESINYTIDLNNLNLEKIDYNIRIYFTTQSLYSSYNDFYITIVGNQEWEEFNPIINIENDNNYGINNIQIINQSDDVNFKKMYIRRSSSLNNFKTWEVLKMITLENGNISTVIEDNTIESMIWYKYSIQVEYLKNGNITYTPIIETEAVINDFYDAMLSQADRQLKMSYNFSISSYKKNVSRNKFDTLGSQYPKFVENGVLNYVSMQITGLISSQMDEQEMFLKKSDIFSSEVNELYNNYNFNNNITDYNDFLWERTFRQELLDWLNNGEPKLFRSETEGNLVVILADVSLSPFQGTSRRLYNFSATLYEVAENTSIDVLDKLNIFPIE